MSLLDSVEAEFSTVKSLREPTRTLDLIRFIIGQGPTYEPSRWDATRATRGRDRRFTPRDLNRLTADLEDPDSSLVNFWQESLDSYHLLLDLGFVFPHKPWYRPTGRVLLTLPYEYFRGTQATKNVEQWLAVLSGTYERIEAYYGYAHETRDQGALSRIRTPGESRPRTDAYAPALFWANFFGPDLVQAVGRERLEQAICWRKEPLPGGGFFLVFSPNPLDFESSREYRNRLYQEWDLERLTMPRRPVQAAQPSPAADTQPVVESAKQCREYADLCVHLAQKLASVKLDHSETSLTRLDDIISHGWQVGQTPEQVIVVMGCYLGETIIRQLGGEWSWQDPGVGLIQPHVQHGRQHLNVIGKVKKRFQFGESDSLAAFYAMVVDRTSTLDQEESM